MIRKTILFSLIVFVVAPSAIADSSRALRDIAFTSMAVRKNREVKTRRAVLDKAFDAASLELRDSLRDPSVRGKDGSQLRKNWFAKAEWYSPEPRRPFDMPNLSMPQQSPSVIARVGSSFQSALGPLKALLSVASQSSWSSVAIVRTLAG